MGPALSAELQTDPIVEGTEVTEEESRRAREAIAGNPLLVGRLIDEDHTVAGVALQLTELGPREMRKAMDELREGLERPEFQDIKLHVGGLPYLRSVIVSKMREDNLRLIPLTLVVCLALLMLSFRWVPGVLLPFGAVAITAVVTVGGMGLVGEPMNILNNVIVPLLIIIGISDATHLIQRYRDEVHADDDPDRRAAGRRTVRAIAVACMLTSATTAVGLGSLVVSKTVMLRHFGVTAGLGVMVSYVVIITFVPAILTWVTPPKREEVRRERTSMFTNVTSSLVARLLRWRWAVLGATALFTVGAGYVASQITVDHALLDQFDETDPVYTTTLLIEEKLAGVRPLEVVLVSTEEDHFMDPEAGASHPENPKLGSPSSRDHPHPELRRHAARVLRTARRRPERSVRELQERQAGKGPRHHDEPTQAQPAVRLAHRRRQEGAHSVQAARRRRPGDDAVPRHARGGHRVRVRR